MKRSITTHDIEATIIGGAILGGGGGGLVEPGRQAARLALEIGTPRLWSIDEFGGQDTIVTVGLVGAPAAPDAHVTGADLLRSLELLRNHLPGSDRIVAVHTNENGSETTINGWLQSAVTGLPVIDFACNGRAHPTSVMGAMGLHTIPDYKAIQAYAGGSGDKYIEGVVTGGMEVTSSLVRRASVEANGWVAVARHPVTVEYAEANGAPGAISVAMEVGRHHIEGGVTAVAESLGGRIIANGTVRDYTCVQSGGRDIGVVRLDDAEETILHFANEYMVLEHGGERIARFPELISTFDEDGVPVPSAVVHKGQNLTVMAAPVDGIPMSPTMFMPELYAPLEAQLGMEFAPATHSG